MRIWRQPVKGTHNRCSSIDLLTYWVSQFSGLALLLLSLTALATAQSVLPFGTCRTFCTGSGSFTTVSWQTTESQCCSGTVNPCPAGMTPGGASYTPAGGFARFCGPVNG